MANADKSRQLSVAQQNAVDILVTGKTDQEVGDAVGVSRQTVWSWRNQNAAFVAALNAKRAEVWGVGSEKLRTLVPLAVAVLEEELASDEPRDRLAAAVHVLKGVGLYGSNLQPEGDTTAEGVAAAWSWQEMMKSPFGFTGSV